MPPVTANNISGIVFLRFKTSKYLTLPNKKAPLHDEEAPDKRKYGGESEFQIETGHECNAGHWVSVIYLILGVEQVVAVYPQLNHIGQLV